MTLAGKYMTFAAMAAALASAAQAKSGSDGVAGRPELLNRLVDCRSLADATARLACYDTQVGAIDLAEKKQDLVVMDRAQVRETRKSLFGFTLPKFSLGGRKLDEHDDIAEINSTVASARQTANGWIVTLADGGIWESNELNTQPRVGEKVHIRKASFGSYLGSIDSGRGASFRRLS